VEGVSDGREREVAEVPEGVAAGPLAGGGSRRQGPHRGSRFLYSGAPSTQPRQVTQVAPVVCDCSARAQQDSWAAGLVARHPLSAGRRCPAAHGWLRHPCGLGTSQVAQPGSPRHRSSLRVLAGLGAKPSERPQLPLRSARCAPQACHPTGRATSTPIRNTWSGFRAFRAPQCTIRTISAVESCRARRAPREYSRGLFRGRTVVRSS
jgi:hypothetical protein